jgi:hypothetical protein
MIFREGADMCATSEQFASPAGDKHPRVKSGDNPPRGFENLLNRVITGAPDSRWYQLFDHYA